MRKIINVMMIMVMLPLLISCSKDEVSEEEVSIAAHWHIVSVYSKILNMKTGAETTKAEKTIALDLKLYDDGTCAYNSNLGTYKVLGKEIDFYITVPNIISEKDELVSYHYLIESLTPTKLILTQTEYSQKKVKSSNVQLEITYYYTLEKLL